MYLTKQHADKKLFLLIVAISFTVFLFTNDGHRYTFDEDLTQKQSMNIATQRPEPGYVQGESRLLFEYPQYFPLNNRPICQNSIICSDAPIGASLTEVPLILINQNLHILSKDAVVWTAADFNDPHYVWWRNTLQQEPDFVFLELTYGPIFAALSVGVFYLVSRTFNYERKSSILLSVLYALTTPIWAYSKTSLNIVPALFFVLLGIWFFRKYQHNSSCKNLILCGTSLGFAFLTRNDSVLFIIPLFVFLLLYLRKKDNKIKNFLSFTIPTLSSYGIFHLINFVRIGTSQISSVTMGGQNSIPTYIGMFGLLLSPGVGLLIFAPILLTMFFSFYDFYKRNKPECILFVSFLVSFLIFYGQSSTWHGLNAWATRYLFVIIPFLLLPLGASIEKRKNKILKVLLIGLGGLGFLFNLVYVIQDVPWFVWGPMVTENTTGLYALGKYTRGLLWTNPLVLWTFEYSQLTYSIIWAVRKLQVDIFLLKVLGIRNFSLILVSLLSVMTYFLLRMLRKESVGTIKSSKI